MDRQTVHPSRRAILGAAPLVAMMSAIPAVAAFQFPSTPDTAPPIDRREWDAAWKRYEIAVQQDSAFNHIFDKVDERRTAERDTIPHALLPANPYFGFAEPTDTRDWRYISTARDHIDWNEASTKPLTQPNEIECHQLCVKAVAIADERAKLLQAIDDRLDYEAIEQRWSDLGERVSDARWVLIGMAAPDLPALAWKLEYLLRDDDGGGCASWSNEFLVQTRADIARLLAGEVAHA